MTIKELKQKIEDIPDEYVVMFAPPDSEWKIAGDISSEYNSIALLRWQGDPKCNRVNDFYKVVSLDNFKLEELKNYPLEELEDQILKHDLVEKLYLVCDYLNVMSVLLKHSDFNKQCSEVLLGIENRIFKAIKYLENNKEKK